MYKWQQVKSLHNQGYKYKQIAKILKVSKNTVKRYLRDGIAPQFKTRTYSKKLDDYQEKILEMLGKRYIGTRIYEELIKEGYTGSLSSIHKYIQGVNKGEKISQLVSTRVETGPGEQMQYDWKEWKVPVADHPVKIYLHEIVLSYSRKKCYCFSLSITSEDIIRAIESSFSFFGGLAKQIVIDNPKQMVITQDKDGVVRYNDEFLRFCGLYGFDPSACRPYRARTKGKAERPFYYLQEHLLRGLKVNDLSEFGIKLQEFTIKYNIRVHSALKESPDKRFEREKEHLRPYLPVDPVFVHQKQQRTISNDGYLSFDGEFYPVPMRLCLQNVWVESIFGVQLRVYDQGGKFIAEYERQLTGGIRPSHPEHEKMNQKYQDKKRNTRSRLVENFSSIFGQVGIDYLEGLKDSVGANLYWHLSEILKYQDIYLVDEIQRAIKECIAIKTYHKNSVLKFLDIKKMKTPPKEGFFLNLRLPQADIRRDLSFYAQVGREEEI